MMKNTLQKKEAKWKKSIKPTDVKKKKKWVPENKVFRGSVNEGKGFALKRKEKVRHEYNKLLRKEKKKKKITPQTALLYREEYPEHLKHLYMAEAAKLKSEAWTNRVNRAKLRMKGQGREAEMEDNDHDATQEAEATAPDPDGTSEAAIEKSTSAPKGLPMSNRVKKKMLKTTSLQRSKEEYEKAKEKRRKKKEEYLQNKQQREEAVRKYKQKKMETFQMLCKKTKKGQPNLNLQMDYLLQKIQKTSKATSKN